MFNTPPQTPKAKTGLRHELCNAQGPLICLKILRLDHHASAFGGIEVPKQCGHTRRVLQRTQALWKFHTVLTA